MSRLVSMAFLMFFAAAVIGGDSTSLEPIIQGGIRMDAVVAENKEESGTSCSVPTWVCTGCKISCPEGKAAICTPGRTEFRLNVEYCVKPASCKCQ